MIKSISSLFGKLVGSKADRDLQEIRPLLNKINEIYPSLASISNDDLRGKTISFREKINDYVAKERNDIKELSAKAEGLQELDLGSISHGAPDTVR